MMIGNGRLVVQSSSMRGRGAPAGARVRALIVLGGVLAVLVGVLALAPVALAGEACPNEQLRVEDNSTGLPDCRAYEMVSPPEKEGARGGVYEYEEVGREEVLGRQAPFPMQAAPLTSPGEEDAVAYMGEPFYQAKYGDSDEYVSRRTPSGWSTTNLTPADVKGEETGVFAFSASLTRYLERSANTGVPEGSVYRNLYVGEVAGPSPQPLITVKPAHRSPLEFGYFDPYIREGTRFLFAPAASDLSRVFFATNDALLPGDGVLEEELGRVVGEEVTAGENNDYLYESDGGRLGLVDVLSDGLVARHASYGYSYGAVVAQHEAPNLDHVVSSDGSRVFWTGEEGGKQNLYVREDGAVTTQVDAAVGGGGLFLAATPDGSRVFFAKGEPSKERNEVVGGDLYEYDLLTRETHDLSGGEARGLVGTSEDGEYVYFIAPGVLTSTANGRREDPVSGGDNLYVYEPDPAHAGQRVMRFVATLAANDNTAVPKNAGVREGGDWNPTVAQRTAEVSPNGRYLAFGSHLPLTGVANNGPEIFLYSAADGGLACASCDPSGASNEGALIPPFLDALGTHRQRYVLNDGVLFFTTSAALVAQDVNGQEDVYEWEDGAPHLISSGTSENPSVFADATESGSDVFFTTRQPLVGQDRDTVVDIYDARVDGGLPAPSAPAGCSTSEGCAGAAPATPGFEPVGSAALGGIGNLAPPVGAPVKAVAPKKRTAAQVRAAALAKALRACGRRPRGSRAACERQARSRFGSKTRSHKGGK